MVLGAVAGVCAGLYLLLLFFLGLISTGSDWPIVEPPAIVSLIVLVLSGFLCFWSRIELRILKQKAGGSKGPVTIKWLQCYYVTLPAGGSDALAAGEGLLLPKSR